ncbi:801_t:CDS:2, partial [Ambispora gerdemannii]
IGLEDKHFNILREQKFKGPAFLELSVEELLQVELKLGPAKTIIKFINKIKGEGQTTTASNQKIQELRERLAILQYLESKVIRLISDDFNSFIQLHSCLKEAFGLKGSLIDYKFVISNKNIDFSWSKNDFVDFIEKHKCSVNNPVRILGVKKGIKRSYMDMIGELPPPSTLGIPKEWFKRQKGDPICLNHHSPEASSTIPVSLYNSIFGKFKDFCVKDPEKKDNEFTYEICYEMAKFDEKEEDRQYVTNKLLKEYLDHPVEILTIKRKNSDNSLKGAHTDGTIFHSKYRGANFEYKCNNCNFGASPYLENYSYYLVFCKEQENSPSFCVTNFPCFLVTIAGSYFSISGAVLADQKHDEMMLSISRTFRALKKSLQILDQYYAQVDYLVQNISQTDHPIHPSFPEVIIDNKSYTNIEYAPKVLASLIIPGNWCLVYMEYLDNYLMLHRISLNLNDQERNCLKEKIEKAVEYLHNLGHVHGDLREGNILVSRLEDNDFDVKLINFEWSGKASSACYSHFMNHKNIQ